MRDINALIQEAGAQLTEVTNLYASTLQEQYPSAPLQAKIKHVVEDQRSALDYLAVAIGERYGVRGKPHYPMARHPNEFPNAFENNLPGVATTRRDIRDAIAARQPFQVGYEWLGHLGTLSNENKHSRLTPQVAKEGGTQLAAGPGGGAIRAPGIDLIHVEEGGTVVFAPGSGIAYDGPGPVTEENLVRSIYVDWIFSELNTSVIVTLHSIQLGVSSLTREVAHVAGL